VRGRPAIIGIVRDAVTGRPLAGARVEVAAAARFDKWLQARAVPHGADWEQMEERPDRVLSAADGRFLLVDLPAAGTVKGPGSAPVALARVTVEGSGESTLTDDSGAFTLAGLETGARNIRAEGRGFDPTTRRVKIATPGAKKTADLRLGSRS
jgi:hypothetical protein